MWAHLLNACLGIWLMASPGILEYAGSARVNDWITGPMVASMGIIASWEITRSLRWVNVMAGLWLLLAPWIFSYGNTLAIWNSELAGAAIVGLSLVRGGRQHSFGGGWRSLFKSARRSPAG